MRTALIAAAVVGSVVAGCGGSSAPSLSAFKSGFSAQKQPFHSLGIDLQHAIATARSKTDAQLASEIAALASRAKHEASSLGQLNPPNRFRANLHNLEAGFNAVSADLTQIARAAAKHDPTAAQAATLALIRDAGTVKAGDTAISSALHLTATG